MDTAARFLLATFALTGCASTGTPSPASQPTIHLARASLAWDDALHSFACEGTGTLLDGPGADVRVERDGADTLRYVGAHTAMIVRFDGHPDEPADPLRDWGALHASVAGEADGTITVRRLGLGRDARIEYEFRPVAGGAVVRYLLDVRTVVRNHARLQIAALQPVAAGNVPTEPALFAHVHDAPGFDLAVHEEAARSAGAFAWAQAIGTMVVLALPGGHAQIPIDSAQATGSGS